MPGLLTGTTGFVGANQPKAIPAPAVAFKFSVVPLQVIIGFATGGIVLALIVTGTVAVHELIVLVKTQ